MKRNKSIFYLLLCLICLLSCKSKNENQTISEESNINEVDEIVKEDSTILIFQDSLTVDEKEKYKFELTQTSPNENDINTLLRISLFKKNNNDWTYLQTLTDTVAGIQNLDVELRDINNDGIPDLNYVYALAGRGYNDLRKHYIFNYKQNNLIAIKNSPEYPNLTYNKDLNCIESHIAHAEYTTVFLQLEADSLREFASIDIYENERIVSIIDKSGKKKIIDRKSYNDNNQTDDLTYGDYDISLLKQYKHQ